MDFITKCECGCDTFHVQKTDIMRASSSKDGTLSCYKFLGEETEIWCRGCDREYTAGDFAEVEYDW